MYENHHFQVWEGSKTNDLGQPRGRLKRLPGQAGWVGWLAVVAGCGGWLAGCGGWLAGWAGWLPSWLAGWLPDWLINARIDQPTDSLTNTSTTKLIN